MDKNNFNKISFETFSNVSTFTVSEISSLIKKKIEESLNFVKVKGEIFRPSFPSSGHVYFTLKDDHASLSAVIWKNVNNNIKIKVEEGQEVICVGKISSFSAQSKYQIIIESMELEGQGTLLKKLNEQKLKFIKLGYFEDSKKLKIPYLPRYIGVITSASGVVIQDIIKTLNERFPSTVYFWPVAVQGKGSSNEIVHAINGFNDVENLKKIHKPDLIILARGGGSLEDLWSFNEDIVVRTIHKSKIPIISAIGHETDFTLSDFVSDLRVSTPTQAAERSVPFINDLKFKVNDFGSRIEKSISLKIEDRKNKLRSIIRILSKQDEMFFLKNQRLDFLCRELELTINSTFLRLDKKISHIMSHISDPKRLIESLDIKNNKLNDKLKDKIREIIYKKEAIFASFTRLLQSNSYENVLNRGFTIIFDKENKAIKLSSEIQKNSSIKIKFYDQERKAKVID